MPHINFIEKSGPLRTLDFTPGETVLSVARRNAIGIEGACDGSMACSTCHVIIAKDWHAHLPPAAAEENAVLDLASGVTRFSRLGCQIRLTAELDGITLTVA